MQIDFSVCQHTMCCLLNIPRTLNPLSCQLKPWHMQCMCNTQVKGKASSLFMGFCSTLLLKKTLDISSYSETGVVNITIFTCGSSASHPYGFWGQKVNNSRHQKELCAQNLKNLHDNLINWSYMWKWKGRFQTIYTFHVSLDKPDVCTMSSHSGILNSFGDVTIAGKGLQILTYARHLKLLSSEGS